MSTIERRLVREEVSGVYYTALRPDEAERLQKIERLAREYFALMDGVFSGASTFLETDEAEGGLRALLEAK